MGEDDERKEVMVSDVGRAQLYAEIERDGFIELPGKDPDFGGEMSGKFRLSLYGIRDAANDWHSTLGTHLISLGCTKGAGHPNVLHNAARGMKTLVHGGDYVSSGFSSSTAWLEEELSKA